MYGSCSLALLEFSCYTDCTAEAHMCNDVATYDAHPSAYEEATYLLEPHLLFHP